MNNLAMIVLLACGATANTGEQVVPDDSPDGPGPVESQLGTWPQWRGPTRDGRDHGPEWPATLSAERVRRLWTVEGLGPSYSGPIVSRDRVFTTATVDEESERVQAFDRATGEPLWSAEWKGAMTVPFFAAKNGSWIRSTPAFDGEALYVAGMRDVLVCLDAESGARRWRVDFTQRYGTDLPSFGFVSSPLVVDEHVYVQAGASFVKLDRATGESLWRTMVDDGGMYGSAFSSPVLASIAGQELLLVQSRSDLAAIAPRSGDVLWSTPIKAFRGMNILTPTVWDDGVFTSAYGGQAQLLRVAERDGRLEVSQAWEAKFQGYMTSPVISDGCAYLFLRSNRFGCMDLATGEHRWTSGPTGADYASLVLQGDRILALDEGGRLRLLRANPVEYELLGEVDLVDGSTWAHLAVAGGQLYVRELGSLSAFVWK